MRQHYKTCNTSRKNDVFITLSLLQLFHGASALVNCTMANDEIRCEPTPSPTSITLQPSPIPTRMNIQTASPTNCDEAIDRKSKIHEHLAVISGTSKLEDSNSAQYQAFEWLVYGDERKLCSNDLGLEQRYIIAVFYFSLSISSWKFCGVDVGKRVVEDGYSSCNEGNVRFLSEEHECSWFGLGCDGDLEIKSIRLGKITYRACFVQEYVELYFFVLPCFLHWRFVLLCVQ